MENKSLGRPTTTSTTSTKRDKPPCSDGEQGGAEYDVFKLTCAAGFVRALADLLACKFGSCGDKDFAAAIVRVCGIAREQADIINGVAGRMAKARGEAGNG